MTTARDYLRGAAVVSPADCRGKVVLIDGGAVTVEYHEKRETWRVTYSREWLAKWGDYLKQVPG